MPWSSLSFVVAQNLKSSRRYERVRSYQLGWAGLPFARISLSFPIWKGRYYEVKQVTPIVVEDEDRIVVVTVYVFYFGGAE